MNTGGRANQEGGMTNDRSPVVCVTDEQPRQPR